MELGSYEDLSQATFALTNEDHTLANSLRFMLNQELPVYLSVLMIKFVTYPSSPRVTFCGYSIPHPSDPRVNIRVQTTGDRASEVLKDSSEHLILMSQHIRSTFDQAITNFKIQEGVEDMHVEK